MSKLKAVEGGEESASPSNLINLADSRALLAAIEEFRKIDPNINGASMAAFLMIGERANTSPAALAEALAVNQPHMSRILSLLEKGRPDVKDRAGLNLVERVLDPSDYRKHTLKLTTKGRSLLRSLGAALVKTRKGGE